MTKRFPATVAAALAAVAALATQAQPQAPVREITKLAGEVYRFRNNNHYSVFAVTPAGVIATDPINAEAARWLKDEIRKRFAQPVRYLVYSHDHADHIAGGEVFADTAVVAAHANAKRTIVAEKRPTAVPQVTFASEMSIELGGTVVELAYVGRNHSDNSIVMRFPKERLLFAVDFIPVESLAFRDFPDAYIQDWIDSLQRVEAMDFDVLVPGHGPLGRKEHVRMFREYMEELRDEVLRHAREGKSVDEVKQLVKMPKYATWTNYEQWLTLNVEGMYRHVQMHRRPN
ncbi:MAG: MBL fold metallo-hydrolase [Candidatus Rokuibacteriota bacterium]|jgi:glyoxylase-like metal-dependent hydrolase (beta-lactamase superfamily II)|nr:MAG: MBL fold metallo-hydrolase [Candidatus Rokubacteria bacterium]